MVFFLQWEKITFSTKPGSDFISDSVLFWRDNKIQLKIHSFWGQGPGGYRTHYEFIVNGETHSFRMLDSYMKGTNGKIPEIKSTSHKLNITALPTKIEIEEESLE
ncbi:MAG: hypothetical protein JXR71_08845 [Bacteroidales bacterium]|nr:hypothetical protein [Bacteroidales bacterium]